MNLQHHQSLPHLLLHLKKILLIILILLHQHLLLLQNKNQQTLHLQNNHLLHQHLLHLLPLRPHLNNKKQILLHLLYLLKMKNLLNLNQNYLLYQHQEKKTVYLHYLKLELQIQVSSNYYKSIKIIFRPEQGRYS